MVNACTACHKEVREEKDLVTVRESKGDFDGDGNKKEVLYKNKYNVFTPRPLRAVYNYQFVAKDPGAFTQNPTYVIQLLRDSLADLGNVAMDGMVRP